MNIDEAATIVAGPRTPSWGAALQALGQFLEACARKQGATATEAEDVAQEVLIKLMRRREAGEQNWLPGQHSGYLKTCAINAVTDLRRRDNDLAPLPDEVADASGSAAADDEGLGHVAEALFEDAKALFEKAAQFARAQRLPRYRAEFDESWGELKAIFYDETPLRTLLEAKLGSVVSESAYLKARDRAYKRHERTRAALLQAVNHLRETGEFTGTDADRVTSALRVFIRCQRGTAPRVTKEKGSP
jgi:DNA-directed RNA polymerase specialized sigma24 family protein